MTPKEYQKLALRTEPSDEQYKAVAERLTNTDTIFSLEMCLTEAQEVLEDLDLLKKHIFYGKNTNLPVYDVDHTPGLMDISDNRDQIEKLQNLTAIRVLHAVIGLATEAGELIGMLRKHLNGGELDLVNGKEEFGDVMWYSALGLDVCDAGFEEVMERNIEKLSARYGEKFSDYKAINRDLETERKILEK